MKEIKHGFFGRHSGVSTGIYSSLNVSSKSGDDLRNIQNNRTIITETLGIDSRLLFLNQKHSNKVVHFDSKTDQNNIEADAFITKEKNIAIGIVTADCTPILAHEPESGFIAGIHAGWKGALSGICENTIQKLRETGLDIKKLAIAIGPCISRKNYEVKHDMVNKFIEKDSRFAIYFEKSGGRVYFDLTKFIQDKFKTLGIHNVETVEQCTYENDKLFFSNRRAFHNNERNFGRMASVICL